MRHRWNTLGKKQITQQELKMKTEKRQDFKIKQEVTARGLTSPDFYCLSGINKTFWDEIKQLKNQIEVFEGQWCPEGWMRFGSSCYYKSTEERDWYDSRSFCEDEGSDLVVVNSKEEQEFVSTLNQNSESWIGLFAGWSQKSEWFWVDGSPLTET
uniref:C-type lectin domain-containing protein n=1 Tax=Oryzias sinensis TaxID=183150 RepID=A0A8C7WS43_9TELE